jgi:hypothetical protein
MNEIERDDHGLLRCSECAALVEVCMGREDTEHAAGCTRGPADGPLCWELESPGEWLGRGDSHVAHAEDLGNGWWCSVYRDVGDGPMVLVFDTTDDDIEPLTGPAARHLCEMIVALDD